MVSLLPYKISSVVHEIIAARSVVGFNRPYETPLPNEHGNRAVAIGRSLLAAQKPAQSSIGSRPTIASFIAWISAAECPTQSSTSRTIRSGSRDRNDLVGLPGNFLSVRFGSSTNAPVGSTS